MTFEELKNCSYAVIGDPVGHSKSPQMQNAGFEFYDMGRPYGKIHVINEELAEFVEYARKNLAGFNITVPHKQAIIPYVDEFTEIGRMCGSINTIRVENGRFYGTSTDGEGLAAAVMEYFSLPAENIRVIFAGAGGAAQAAAWYFAFKGAKAITICNRSIERAQELASDLKKAFPSLETSAYLLNDTSAISQAVENSDLLVQSTSVGLKDEDGIPFDTAVFDGNKNICVYDLVYKETKLLRFCRENGIKCADGSDMLLYQGAAAFEFWTERKAPVEAMRRGLEEAK